MRDKPLIFLAYIKVKSFSGQTASTVILRDLLKADGYEVKEIFLYPVYRDKLIIIELFNWFFKTLNTLSIVKKLAASSNCVLYINVGQSFFSLFRIGWWFILSTTFNNYPIIMSLNGHDFMSWSKSDTITKLFVTLLNRANIVTITGPSQRLKLAELGVQEEKIHILNNTLDSGFVSGKELRDKYNSKDEVFILYLSLLIESKGFEEFIDAIPIYADYFSDKILNVTLCGPIVRTKFCNKFKNTAQVQELIELKVDKMNRSLDNVNFNWIPGANGQAKFQLFKKSHIFILPTYYPNEAQPLVLMEAMAAGCSVITTRAGEIASTFNSSECLFIDEVSPDAIARSVIKVLSDDSLMEYLAFNGYQKVYNDYSPTRYKEEWLSLINKVGKK